MVDSNGELRVHRRFDGFGNIVDETHYDTGGDEVFWSDPGYVDEAFAFTGRWFDKATGLQNNLNRWYDPQIGRWLSEDPIGFKASDANLYRYVGNSPTNSVDPSGLDRQIGIWFGHGFIDIIHHDGSRERLNFGPGRGFYSYHVIRGEEQSDGSILCKRIKSTPQEDRVLQDLWELLEEKRRAGKIPSWLLNSRGEMALHWNCWTPVCLFSHAGIGMFPKPPATQYFEHIGPPDSWNPEDGDVWEQHPPQPPHSDGPGDSWPPCDG